MKELVIEVSRPKAVQSFNKLGYVISSEILLVIWVTWLLGYAKYKSHVLIAWIYSELSTTRF